MSSSWAPGPHTGPKAHNTNQSIADLKRCCFAHSNLEKDTASTYSALSLQLSVILCHTLATSLLCSSFVVSVCHFSISFSIPLCPIHMFSVRRQLSHSFCVLPLAASTVLLPWAGTLRRLHCQASAIFSKAGKLVARPQYPNSSPSGSGSNCSCSSSQSHGPHS